jgi:protein-tyrosine phosphatase
MFFPPGASCPGILAPNQKVADDAGMTRKSDLSWIGGERIAVGSLPAAATVPLLPGQGITHIVNCRARLQVLVSQDLAAERRVFGADHVAHAPMRDLGRPQPPRLWAAAACFAARVLDEEPGAGVLIHCTAGRRRSVLVAYATLRLRGHQAAEAAALILSHRTIAELVPAYARSVEQWLDMSITGCGSCSGNHSPL